MRNDQAKIRCASAAVVVLASGMSTLAMNAFAQPENAVHSDEVEQVVEVVRKAYDEAREALGQLPRERFETGSVLNTTDFDGESIVTWVEQNTRWVPYRGVLRGADGVLLDRSGNSLDRSLLLARLLEDASYDTRLVRGQLSTEAVQAVLSQAASTATESQPPKPLFPAGVVAAAEKAASEANALANLVGTLLDHVGREAEEAAADHWWVEAQLDTGWSVVDPLLNGPLAAMRPAPLERFATESLPDSLFHKVTVRVVIERWDAGETVEEVPLEHTLRTAEAVYHDLELQFVPYHFEPAPDGSTAAIEARAIAETAEEWLPVLRRGSDTFQQQGFDRQGNLESNPGRVAVARKAEAAGSALQGLGDSSKPQATHLTALWLEYRVEVPGRKPRIVRRELFDLIGPPSRRSGAISGLTLDSTAFHQRGRLLLGTHRILVTSNAPPPIALEKAAWELWANHGPQIAAIVRLMQDPNDEEAMERAYREPLMSLDLLGLATARHVLSPHRSAIYLESPNILTTHFTVEMEEGFSVRRAFDLVVNDIGVIETGSVPPARIRLEQGVLDTILEAAMLEPEERSGNAADLFALRDGATGRWRRVDAQSPDLDLPGTAQARIADALAAGRIVVAPAQLGDEQAPAWWEIDPATGTTLGIGHRGWGVVAEQTVRGIGTTGLVHGARRYGIRISCRVVFVFLKMNGWIFTNISGGLTYTVQAMEFLLRRGCGVVV